MTVVLDAGVIVAQVVEVDWAAAARARFREWVEAETLLVAPSLWQYEATSTLRKLTTFGAITTAEADEVLDGVHALNIETIEPTPEVHRSALAWAARLGTRAAYDACYLAVAERLHASFWTSDRRLFRGARAAGADWVHDIIAIAEADSEATSPPETE